ncbi:hypothetical protein [Prevotella sp. KH2C16]|uniref:DUF6630 family protein n=1 Tax=Prevotella sp. KH2C16 TaxID=1855325 RepID=UPI0008F3845F|nr:hypothetical protein [Prevotella sp. KH2C16]SFG24608.1 hypothetical protein SAMN05216383_1083 [Prevotella sp. KH2C16]
MKEKLTSLFGTLLLVAFAVGCGWMAVEMFRQGAWVKGIFGVLGVLLFGSPLLIPLFSSPAKPEIVPRLVPQVDLPEDKEALLALARRVAGDDETTMQAVMESMENPEDFYLARVYADVEDRYGYDYVWDTYHDNPEALRAQGLLCVLTEAKAIAMFDWKEFSDNFVDEMVELRRVQLHHLPISEGLLDTAADVPHWCYALNELWQLLGYETMFIDINVDEYLVAVVPYPPNPYPR